MHLTDIVIRNLQPPEKGQVTYTDDSISGFGIRVSQGGVKTFVLVYGRSRTRMTIGRYPTISLADARTKAREVLAEWTLGKHRVPTISFADALTQYITNRLEKELRPSSAKEAARVLKKHFLPKLRHEKLADLSTVTLTNIVDKIAAPSTRRHAFSNLRAFLRWTRSRGYLTHSPLEGAPAPQTSKPRERVLTDAELVLILKTARAEASSFNRLVELLILTGQRRNQIASLQASFIDYTEQTITWSPGLMKGNREHTIPYGAATKALLDKLPKEGLLLPGRSETPKPMVGYSKLKPKFDKEVTEINEGKPLPGWTLHDLRRTLASGWQAMGIRIEVTEKYLAHTSGSLGGIVGVYQRHHYLPEMRAAVTAWEEKLQKLLNP